MFLAIEQSAGAFFANLDADELFVLTIILVPQVRLVLGLRKHTDIGLVVVPFVAAKVRWDASSLALISQRLGPDVMHWPSFFAALATDDDPIDSSRRTLPMVLVAVKSEAIASVQFP